LTYIINLNVEFNTTEPFLGWIQLHGSTDKLKLTGQTWDEFSSLDSAEFVQAMNCIYFVKQPSLKLKTQPKQLLGSLPLAFELPD
jgi:hypothetical protein